MPISDPKAVLDRITSMLPEPTQEKIQDLKEAAKSATLDVAEGIVRVGEQVYPAALAACATVQFRGSQGSFMAFVTPVRFTARFIRIGDDKSDYIGYPTGSTMQLSACTGFVLCENAVIAISGTVVEERAIEDMLNSGVFVE